MKNIYSLSSVGSSNSLVSLLKNVSLKVKMLVVLAALGFSFNGNSQTVVYNIGLSGLIDQASNCGTAGQYNGCSGNYGATWTSTNSGTPTSVSVQFFTGVNCSGAGIRTKNLNGVNNGSFSIPAGAGCFCSGTGQSVFTNLNPANYNPGGTNTFLISGVSSCEGFDNIFGANIYVRVTVQYAPNPCNSISTISCDSPTNFSLPSGSGSFNGNGPFSTPGNEKIFSFTAPVTGSYALNVIHPSSYYVDLFYKTSGCSSSGWTYVNDVFSNETSNLNLTGGVTYLFLLDDENTSASSGTFTINCPSPCNDITALSGCGATGSFNLSGSGVFNGNGPFSTPGNEKVFSFVPPTSGLYDVRVIHPSSYYVDLFFSTSCGPNTWTYLNDVFNDETSQVSLTGGVTYYFLIDDENTTTSTGSIIIDCPCNVTASSSAPPIACFGGTTNVTVSGSGGTAPYSGAGTFSRPAGTYNFPITDANGCTANTTISISQPSPVVASATASAIACAGGQSTVTVTGAGGTPGYSGTGTFSRPAGTHTFTVTDANGCSDNVTITIGQPSPVVASASASPIICNGDQSTVTVTGSGGTPGYNGTGSFSASAGTQTYSVTDANGCEDEVTITITEPGPIGLNVTMDQDICLGESTTLTANAPSNTGIGVGNVSGTLQAQNGNQLFSSAGPCDCPTGYVAVGYEGNTGAFFDRVRLICKEVLPNGDLSPSVAYTCFIGTSGGGSYSGPKFIPGNEVMVGAYVRAGDKVDYLQGKGQSIADIAAGVNNASGASTAPGMGNQFGGNNQGTFYAPPGHVIVGVRGFTSGPYPSGLQFRYAPLTSVVGSGSYAWSNGANTASTTVSPSSTTNYTVTYTSPEGCIVSDDVLVTVNDVTASATATPILCNGGTSTVTVTASGAAPYSGTGTFTVPAGTHTFTVTDANGCSDDVTITITEPSQLSLSISATEILCNGETTDIAVSASGGTAPYTGTGTFTESAGTYSYTITDANGCSETISITVNEPTQLTASATASVIPCLGGTTDVTVSAAGGTAPYTGTGAFNVAAGTYTYTVTDSKGCTADVTITVTENDNIPPNAVCQNLTIDLDASGNASITADDIDNGSSDACGIASLSLSQTAFDCSDIGANTVTLTVLDNGGNTSTCTATVTVNDNVAPVANCQDLTIELDASGNASITADDIDDGSSDACGIASLTASQTAFDCSNVGANTVTLTVVDNNGNTSTCTSTVTVNDNVAPVANCQDLTIELDASGNASITASNNVLANSSTDFSGSQGGNGWTYGHYLAFNPNNNFIPLSFNGFVWNNPGVGQAFDFPQLDPNGGHPAQTNLYWAVRRWTSNFSGNINISGDFFDRNTSCGDGANVRIFKNGTQVYEYLNIPGGSVPYSIPLTVASGDIIDFAIDPKFDFGCDDTHFTASISSAMGIDDGSSDACGIQSLSVSQTAFDCSNVGPNTVTLTVVDNNGNTSTCTSTVTVNDNVAPVANCQDLTIELDASGNASITADDIDNGSNDACGIASLTASQTAFDCSNVGANTVTLTVVDNNGNTSTCTSTVTVNDNVAPVANCQDLTIELDASGNASITADDIDNGSNDACGIASLTASQTAFDCSNVGANTVTLTVVDNNGNTSTCTSTVTVNDNVAPVANCQDLTIELDASGNASITADDIDNGSNDACGIASLTASQTAFDCSNVGANTVTLTVVDNNGNTSTCTSTVTVNDNVAPVANCQDLTIELDASGNASITADDIDNGSSDACGIASLTASQTAFDCSNVGGNTVTLTVVDNNGNTSTCTSTVTVNDNVAPVANCQDLTIELDASGNASITADDIDNGSNDACGIASLTASQTAFDCSNVGANTVTLTVVDNNGNTSTCTSTVTVNDNVAPVANCQDLTIELDASGNASITADDIDDGSSDACGIASLTASQTAFDCSNVGANTVTLTVVDNNGNTSTCTSTVTVNDNVAPVANCQDLTIELDASGNASITADDIDDGSSDACGIASLTASQTAFDCSNVGANTVTLTVVDNNGNTSTCTSTVTVNDNVAPVANCQDLTIELDASGNASITADDVDNGSNDACGIASLAVSQENFDCSNVGTNPVTLTVTDNNGNVTTCGATITVNDNVAPIAICQDLTIELDANGNASITADDVDNGSNDACGIASLAVSQENFDCSNVGTNPVTLTVTDNNGNVTTCGATITVNDNVAPVAICQDLTIELDANGNASITADDVDNGSNDACGIASLAVSQEAFDCSNVGTNPVTLTVTDNNGNVTTCGATITVNDNVAPIAICQDLTIELDASGNASITANDIDNGSSDACGIASLTASQTAFDCSNVGANTVTLTVVDNNGNSSTCTSTVTVNDNIAPTAICQDLTVTLDANGNASVTASDLDNGSFDNCGIASLSILSGTSSYTCDDVEQTFPVTLLVTDVNGNSSTCVSQVTVGGTIIVASASATTILCFGGTADVTVTATGGALPYVGTGTFTVFAGTYTYTVTDAQSCSSDVTIVVDQPDQIEANITPQNHVIDCIPIPVDLTANPTGGTGGPYTYLWSTGETTQSIEVNPNVTTTYTVEIWDANGCTVNAATNGTTVTVLNRCGNNNQKVVICHVPPGNTGNPQTICISPNALNPHLADLWNLHGGDYCGPCQTSNSMIASDNINKGDNMFIRAGINMNNETIDLSYRIGYDSPVRLEIYDMAGTLVEVVHESHASEGELYEFKLNTSKISSGVYIYQFITNNEKHIDKLQIIQ